MKTVLQIRGANASGKSTAVRQFIETHPHRQATLCGFECTEVDIPDRVIVIGEYASKYGGVDVMSVGNGDLKRIIDEALNKWDAEYVIFENFIRSYSFKFSAELAAHLDGMGVAYRNLFLYTPFSVAVQRIEERTGRSPNVEGLMGAMKSVDNCYRKLCRAKIHAERKNTAKVPKEAMAALVEEALA